jgi:LuxR family transcriptional regulator, maltose regulon positive regulatory protein
VDLSAHQPGAELQPPGGGGDGLGESSSGDGRTAVLAATKLEPPRVRRALVRRERLISLLTSEPVKLALIDAPAGSGKTTLLSEWAAEDERPFAWLSLDRGDNDPVRCFEGVIEGLRSVEPGVGAHALTALAGGSSLTEVVLPSLINDLHGIGRPLVLALDDYHVVGNARVHEALTFLLEHQPSSLQLAVASRTQPPLPLGRLRVRRELVEVRAAELRFTDEETAALLNGVLDLELAPADIARLQLRTEGWAAGLQLAALSLHGREDRHSFISSFAGDDRPIVDYLGFEVLDGQPEAVRRFLLRTSILDRLSAPLCDAVTAADDSAERLLELERANLFLVPLDTKRGWYRYHHLFRDLLRHELSRTEPELVPELHRRACAWYRSEDLVTEAIHHATVAGDVADASELITLHWYGYLQRGRIETVAGWLDALGDEVVADHADLALTQAWIGVNTGRLDEVGRWIASAEAALRARAASGGGPVLEAGLASLREISSYMNGDVGQAVEQGRRSVEGGTTPWRPVGCPVLGIALFWTGRPDEAAEELEDSVEIARAAGNHLAMIHAFGALAAIRAEQGDLAEADRVASAALALAEERGLGEHWATTLARVTHGRALEQGGRLSEAADAIRVGTELSQRGVAGVEIAFALLAQAEARQLEGDGDGALALLREAKRRVGECPDPGILARMVAQTERRLRAAPRRPDGAASGEDLTERELALLRLLPSELSLREIADSLYVSRNTVKTHARAVYRKLGASTRDQAVGRARELGLL